MKRCFLLVLIFISMAMAPGLLAQAGDTLWRAATKAIVLGVKFSPDDRYIYAVTIAGVEKHDAVTGELISEFKGYFQGSDQVILPAKFSSNCTKVMVYTDSLTIWDIEKEELQWKSSLKINSQGYQVGTGCLSPDGKYAYITDFDSLDKRNLLVYNLNSRSEEKLLDQDGKIKIIASSPDGKYLAIGSKDKWKDFCKVTLWDAINMKPLKVIDSASSLGVSLLNFSYDSKKLAFVITLSGQFYVSIYDVESGTIQRLYDSTSTDCSAFSRDNKFFAGVTYIDEYDSVSKGFMSYPSVQIASAADGKMRKRYYKLDGTFIDISHDNSKLASSGFDEQGTRIVMLAPKFNTISVNEAPSAPKPYSFEQIENALSISPSSTCTLSKADISNSSGQTLISRNLNQEQGTISVDISGLASGAYFCRITCGGNVFTEKFVVVK